MGMQVNNPNPKSSRWLGVYPKGGRYEVRLSSSMLRGAPGVTASQNSNNCNFMLGSFETELEAARAYDEIAG